MFSTGRQQDAVPPARLQALAQGDQFDPQVWQTRWTTVVDHLEPLLTESGVEQLVDDLMARTGPVTMAFVNAHVMNLIVSQPLLSRWLRDTDLVLRDGIGVSILLRILGVSPGLNLNGTDLIPRLIARVNAYPIALFGTAEPHLGRAAQAIATRHGRTTEDITTANGFHEDRHYVDLCLSRRPRLVVLGMGVPKQERIAALLKSELTHNCLIVCGGAILDFYASRFRRAPAAMRRLNMEWMFRLALEPMRLFGRYVIGNPVFLLRAASVRLMSGTLSRHQRHRWSENVPSLQLNELLQHDAAELLGPVSTVPVSIEVPAIGITPPVTAATRERETSL